MAGWYDSAWDFRTPVAVDNSSTPGTTIDVQIPWPDDDDHFWSNTQADGDDIRVTGADGQELQSYSLSGWNQANRTLTIEVDATTGDADASCVLLWVYYGNDAATDGSVATTITSAKSGYVHLGTPRDYVVTVRPPRPGVTLPEQFIQKHSGETIYVWFDLSAVLEKRGRAFNSRSGWECPQAVVSLVQDSAPSAVASMIDQSATRFVETRGAGGRRRFFVGLLIKAGTDGNWYTISPTIETFAPEITISGGALVAGTYRTLSPRARIKIEDLTE